MTEEFIDEARTGQPQPTEIESIWLTKPSIKPIVLAVAMLITLIGLFAFRPLMIIGLIALLITLIAWIGESRSESDELPLT